MKALLELHGCYEDIDAYLDLQWKKLSANRDEQAKIERRQRINDQAYFVLLWGQFETEIDEVCRSAINKRSNNPDWSKRRAWDLYNPNDKRLSGLNFEDRTSLILDKKSAEWKIAMKYYHLRNFVAHGGSHEARIDLANVVTDFYRVQSKLTS
jgi:hypothetical protein